MKTMQRLPAFHRRALLGLLAAAALGIGFVRVAAQEEQEVRGEAILKHPIGTLAMQTVDLLSAGKTEQVVALRSKADQAEWKKMPADERKAMSERMRERAPEPAAFREAIKKAGVLTLAENHARLEAPMGKREAALAMYELEEGKWRASAGPMVVDRPGDPAKEVRIQGAEILEHPIGKLVLQYADLLHAGKMDDVMKLATAKAQADWKAESAAERKESADYRRKMLPKRAELAAAIASGGVLIIDDDTLATLNLIVIETTTTAPGEMSSTSTTTGVGFEKENGAWRVRS